MRVEEHDLSRPHSADESLVEGVPGTTKKSIWDAGAHRTKGFGEGMVVRPRGGRLDGRYATFRAGGGRPVHKKRPAGNG